MKKKLNIEDIFLSALGSDKRLRWYLQYEINLVKYLDSAWARYTAFIDLTFALIPREKRRELVGDISSARILKLLEKERSDLHKTLMKHPKGKIWLDEQVKNFEERFL